MTIKVIIRRKIKEGSLGQAARLLIQARQNAMTETGYISSETLSGCVDPNEILVLAMWQRKEDWNRYREGDLRRELEARFAEITEGPSQTIAYELGIQDS